LAVTTSFNFWIMNSEPQFSLGIWVAQFADFQLLPHRHFTDTAVSICLINFNKLLSSWFSKASSCSSFDFKDERLSRLAETASQVSYVRPFVFQLNKILICRFSFNPHNQSSSGFLLAGNF
jgi:hypothetical protein